MLMTLAPRFTASTIEAITLALERSLFSIRILQSNPAPAIPFSLLVAAHDGLHLRYLGVAPQAPREVREPLAAGHGDRHHADLGHRRAGPAQAESRRDGIGGRHRSGRAQGVGLLEQDHRPPAALGRRRG